MSRRIAFHHVITVVLIGGLLFGLVGCSGKGGVTVTGVPPQVAFKSLQTLQYGSTIPITIKVDSDSATEASLVFLFNQGL